MPRAIDDRQLEADRLAEIIESRIADLTAGRLGRNFRLDRFAFRLFRRDRNTIYRVSGTAAWFLKLLAAGNALAIERESLGAQLIPPTLASANEWGGSTVIRVSRSPAYVLAEAIQGRPLASVIITDSIAPWPSASARLERTFASFGTLLGTLHANVVLPPGAPAGEKREFASVASGLRRMKHPDDVTAAIDRWHQQKALSDDGSNFIHGNMRLDNVLRTGHRIAFIDFEHCGSGAFYQDLGRPVAYLLQVSAISDFARRRVGRCLRAYLASYRRVQRFERDPLDAFVSARLARYYLETRKRQTRVRSIAGLPVTSARIARLTTTVLREGVAGIYPDVYD